MSSGKRSNGFIVLAIGLAFAGLGHYYLLYRRVYVWDAVLFYAVAATCLAWAYAWAVAPPAHVDESLRIVRRRAGLLRDALFLGDVPTRILVGMLVVANVLAALGAFVMRPPVSVAVAVLLDLGSILVAIAIWLVEEPSVSTEASAPLAERDEASLDTVESPPASGQHEWDGVRRWLAGLRSIRPEPVLFLALAVAGTAQYTFNHGGAGWTWGVRIFLLVFPVTSLFAYLERLRPERGGDEPPGIDWSPRPFALFKGLGLAGKAWRIVLVALALVADVICALLAKEAANNLSAAFAWLVAVVLFLVACSPKFAAPRMARWREFMRRHWVELALAVVILGGGLFARLYGLGQFYGAVEQDEGQFGGEALEVMGGGWQPPLFGVARVFFHTAIFTYLQAASMGVFGRSIVGLRVLPGVMGGLSLLFVYLLARRSLGRTVGLVAGFLVAVSPHHLFFSRIGIHDMVVMQLFIPATVYFFYRGLHSRRTLDYALAGVVWGTGLWLDYNNKIMILVPIMGVILIYLALTRWRYWRHEYPQIGVLLLGVVVVMLPLWSTLAHTGQAALVPLRGKSVLSESGLAEARARYGVSTASEVMVKQVERNVFAVNYFGDQSFLSVYASWLKRPILESALAVLFFVGLAYSVWRWKDPRYAMLLVWWGVGMQGGIWTVSPPQAHRLTPLLIPAYIMAAIGLDRVTRALVALARLRPFARRLGEPVVLGVILPLFLGYVGYGDLSVYFSPRSRDFSWEVGVGENLAWMGLAETGETIEELMASGYDVYYLGAPWTYAAGIGHGTIVFHSHLRSRQATDVEDVRTVAPLSMEAARDVAFVMPPSHLGDLVTLQSCYPGGTLEDWYDQAQNRIGLQVYRVTRDGANHPQCGLSVGKKGGGLW